MPIQLALRFDEARARGCSVPDTGQQRDWVINLVKDISGPL
jgi:hypothetical protein